MPPRDRRRAGRPGDPRQQPPDLGNAKLRRSRANGDVFIFVDADTLATADAVRDVIAAIGKGAAGGGCLFRFDGSLPRWARLTYPIGIRLFRLLNVVGGCFLFCTRHTFEATGGFSQDHFAAEELIFTNAVKRWESSSFLRQWWSPPAVSSAPIPASRSCGRSSRSPVAVHVRIGPGKAWKSGTANAAPIRKRSLRREYAIVP